MTFQEAKGSISRYVLKHIEPGGFMRAVLENDLMGAYSRADQSSARNMKEIVMFVYNKVPAGLWGSPERVKNWLDPSTEDHKLVEAIKYRYRLNCGIPQPEHSDQEE